MSEQIDHTPRSEEVIREQNHEPEPVNEPPPRTVSCPCGYSELVKPIWRPYLKSSGWVLAWYFGVKCPKHGWASQLWAVRQKPVFQGKANCDILEFNALDEQ